MIRRSAWTLSAVLLATLLTPAVASAAGHLPGVPVVDVLGIGGKLNDLLGSIKGVVVGGVNWTTDVAADFIVNTLGGLVDMLIPDKWADQGLGIMQWVVAVPNYAAQLTGPGGAHGYAFAGINDLRDLFVWIGIALLPLSLTYASTRAMFGLGDHAVMPIARTFSIGVVLISYTWLWGQFAAVCNQMTKAILGVPTVSAGINKLFELIVGGGVLLGGLPLIGLILMGAAGMALLASIFVKVLMILVGALVYVTGPLMIGVAPTERGAAAARAWLTLATGLFLLPVVWATVFAIAALLMNDSSGAAAIIGTDSDLGQVLGGLVLALAAIAGFWLNLKLTRFVVAVLGGQVAAMLALATSGEGVSAAANRSSAPGNARDALSSFGSRLTGAIHGAGAPLASSGRAGAALSTIGGGAGALARGGLLGAGGGLAKRGAGAAAASPSGQALGTTKAGALATRIARAGRSGWKNPSGPTSGSTTPSAAKSDTNAARSAGSVTGAPAPRNDGRDGTSPGPAAAPRGAGAASTATPSSSAPPEPPSSGARPDTPASTTRSQPTPRGDAPAAPRPSGPPSPDRSDPRSSRGPRVPRRRKGR